MSEAKQLDYVRNQIIYLNLNMAATKPYNLKFEKFSKEKIEKPIILNKNHQITWY